MMPDPNLEDGCRTELHKRADGAAPAFLTGGGEMGALMRALDWSKTPLGLPETWPPSLRTALSIVLASRHPMFIWWGPQLIQFYNDGYRPSLGADKHPQALGQPGRECWPEIWPIIGPQIEAVMERGESTWHQDHLVPIDRNNRREEVYWTYGYSPIRDEGGAVCGVLVVVNETTETVVSQRRLRTLGELAAETGKAPTAEDVCGTAARVLAGNRNDLPFALVYLLDADGKRAHLAGRTGLDPDTPAAPPQIDLARPQEASPAIWPIARVAQRATPQRVQDAGARFGPLPGDPWPEPCEEALVLPISQPGQERSTGVLVAGISPRRPLDADYRRFLELVADRIATAVANVRVYEAERKRAEALAKLNRAKSAFFGNVSHEFRTPLTLMLGPLEDSLADAEHPLPPGQRQRQEVVQRSALRLLKMVNNLLEFSRIEAGSVQAVYEPTDLATYTVELASVFGAAVERAGLRLVVDAPPLPEPVYVDREMWEKVVLNLLSNAFKFTFAGEIEVRLRPTNGCVALSVRDSGTGIPAEELPRLFERFHRVQGARGRTNEGTGIGLALVQELVQLHGGDVQVTSTVGHGSTFTVTIPKGKAHLPPDRIAARRKLASTVLGAMPYVEEALRWLPDGEDSTSEVALAAGVPREDKEPQTNEQKRSAGSEARIILADDNADMRDYVRHLLSRHYDVIAVADGAAALAAAREQAPDLVLTDVMMPGLDGFELLRELRTDEKLKEIPIVLLSARAGEESRIEGLEAGADDYLVKPFTARELLARVGASLALARARREAQAALRHSEQRFRATFEQAAVGMAHVAPNGTWLRANRKFSEIVGYSLEELSQLKFEEITHADDRDASRQLARRLLENEMRTASLEKRYVRKDGSVIWINLTTSLVRDDAGKPQYFISVYEDISSRKRTELLLLEQNRLLELIASGTPLDECLTILCAAVPRLSQGVRASVLLADEERRSFQRAIAPDFPSSFSEGLQGASINELLSGSDDDAFHRAGPITWQDIARDENWSREWHDLCVASGLMAGHSTPILGADGRALGFFFLGFDDPRAPNDWEYRLAEFGVHIAGFAIERDRSHKALRESELRFRTMMEQSPLSMQIFDPDGYTLMVNSAWERMWDASREELSGYSILKDKQLEGRGLMPYIRQAFAGEEIRLPATYYDPALIGKSGRARWIEGYIYPLISREGQTVEVALVHHDVTDLKQAQAQLEADLTDAKLLQSISAQLIQEDDAEALYEKILDAVVGIMRSDYGSIQLLHPQRGSSGELHLLAFRGFSAQAARFWEWVRADSDSICGIALRSGERVIVPDVEKSELMAGTEDLAMCLQTGIHAVQSSPLVSRDGHLLGMISTHWREPHRPSERDLRLVDILARQAADFIERKQAEEALEAARVEAEIERGRLATLITQAPAAITVLRGPQHVFEIANKHYRRLIGNRDVIGKPVREALPDITGQGYYELLDEVYSTGQPFVADGMRVMLDNQKKGIPEENFLNFVYQPIVEAGGSVSGIFVHAVNVTEQVRARQRIEDLAAKLKVLNETLEERIAERTAELVESEEQVRRMASRLTMAEQEERRRIARVLHDDLQQQLYGVQMKLTFAREEVEAHDAAAAVRSMTEVEELLDQGIEITRRLTVDLSPPILKSEGLADMLAWLVSQMREMYGLKVTLVGWRPLRMADEDMRLLLFQIVRELLFNVVKHAAASHATVELNDSDGQLVISVVDDGRGFDVERMAARAEGEGGFGLFSARERLGLFGGRMEIESAPGEGARVVLYVPTVQDTLPENREEAGP